ncbi:MAG: hypothetical protein D6794_07380 [Deltaproteobacteria bacterium]|nr:MAG: hypothetical protein D6794_07380 [Deltaproteobacteria bacterium]
MEAIKIREAVACHCGGHPKIFGPCEFAPRSHWGIYCDNPACECMASGVSLDDAVEDWNLKQVHPYL